MIKKLATCLRNVGQCMDKFGVSIEGECAYIEHLVPSTRVIKYKGITPKVGYKTFIASNASIIGDVEIGERSSLWYGAVARGDVNHIRIGNLTNIQDRAVIHVESNGSPTIIGNHVTIGPNAIVHACTLKDQCIIGTGSQILDGATIGKNSMIAAGSIVTKNKNIPDGQLWSGIPARYVRDLTSKEIAFIKRCAEEYAELGQYYNKEENKGREELMEEQANAEGSDRVMHLPNEVASKNIYNCE